MDTLQSTDMLHVAETEHAGLIIVMQNVIKIISLAQWERTSSGQYFRFLPFVVVPDRICYPRGPLESRHDLLLAGSECETSGFRCNWTEHKNNIIKFDRMVVFVFVPPLPPPLSLSDPRCWIDLRTHSTATSNKRPAAVSFTNTQNKNIQTGTESHTHRSDPLTSRLEPAADRKRRVSGTDSGDLTPNVCLSFLKLSNAPITRRAVTRVQLLTTSRWTITPIHQLTEADQHHFRSDVVRERHLPSQ